MRERFKYLKVPIYLLVILTIAYCSFIILESSMYGFDLSKLSTLPPINTASIWGGFYFLSLLLVTMYAIFGNIFLVSGIFFVMAIILAISNSEKLAELNQPLFYSDLSLIFHPIEMLKMINIFDFILPIIGVIFLITLLSTFQFVLWNKKMNEWGSKFFKKSHYYIIRVVSSVLLIFLVLILMYRPDSTLTHTIMRKNSSSGRSDFNMVHAYRNDGMVHTFIRDVNPTATVAPSNYSEKKLLGILNKYEKKANEMNKTRTNKGKDRKVIIMLSETFTDPRRLEGIEFQGNPIPNIEKLKVENTGGEIIVPGIGGGTSNTEWNVLTGMSLWGLSPGIGSPYPAFYFKQNKPKTILDVLDPKKDSTVAVHASPPIYYRNSDVYKNIGVREYFSTATIKSMESINPVNNYISDASFFDAVLDKIKDKNTKVVLSQSMQNHTRQSYKYFKDGRFKVSSNMSHDNLELSQNYIQGLSITDNEIMKFLDKLEKEKDDITLVFYGDHLPTAFKDLEKYNDAIEMRRTDYFIYNNHNYKKNKEERSIVKQEFDQFGQVVQEYDELGNPLIRYDQFGQVIQEYDELGNPLIRYDQFGNVIVDNNELADKKIIYDQNGNPVKIKDEAVKNDSPNPINAMFLMNQLLDDLDIKLSPYYALLEEIKNEGIIIPPNQEKLSKKLFDFKSLTKKQKELLEDYLLVQHDSLSGKQYVIDDFFKQPEK